MKIIYIGDIMGEMGIRAIEKLLPELKHEYQPDLIIAQAENVSDGKGIAIEDYRYLQSLGIDFFTGGNWTLEKEEIWPLLNDESEPIIRPANYPSNTPGIGYKYVQKNNKNTLVVSLLGQIVGKDSEKPMDNPLKCVDHILEANAQVSRDATVVNFHGDFSSEKVIIGHYLDGKVTAVLGDHWHVPTADARILDKGTAHVSDVGMCGALNASLGISLDSVIPRWKNNLKTRNILEDDGAMQFNAILIEVNGNGLASKAQQIQRYIK